MPERLLTIVEVAKRLGVERTWIYRHLHELKAKGLQQVPVGPRLIRFREASLDAMIKRAAEREEKLF